MKFFGKIPFSMSLSFWLVAGLIGYLNTHNLIGTCVWISVIFISVLVHELGHAIVAYWLGLFPRIELIAFGGLTRYAPGNLSLGKQFLIVVAGPLCGIFLFLVSFFLLQHVSFQSYFIMNFFELLLGVNLFWTAANFIPVLPLDGGQMLRIGLEVCFKRNAYYYALIIGLIVALLLGVFFFLINLFLFGSFLFLFAFQNYTDLKNEKVRINKDISEELQKKFAKGEEELRLGFKEKALKSFRDILEVVPQGNIENLSAEYLAFLEYDRGEKETAFKLLILRRKSLSKDGLYLLHKLSFELEHYNTVVELSGMCFQSFPVVDVAMRAAKSHAKQGQVEACLGWLDTSLDLGVTRSLDLISDAVFDAIRELPAFTKWVKSRLFL